MKSSTNLKETLQQFLALLKVEKTALIKNDGQQIEEIVKEKQSFLKMMQELDPSDMTEQEVVEDVRKIQELQETNLMLTKQALQFQEGVLDAISKTAKKSGHTYSKKGTYAASKHPNLINQSI